MTPTAIIYKSCKTIIYRYYHVRTGMTPEVGVMDFQEAIATATCSWEIVGYHPSY